MAEVKLVAEVGRPIGSSSSRRLRHTGRVPAVVYGHGMKPLPISVGARDLRSALSVHGLNQVLTLDVDGSTHLVLARQLQRHPVRHTVAHVDFQVVRRDEVVSAEVPLVLVGTATQVERERGLLEHTLTSLSVRSTPEQIPQEIRVDVSALGDRWCYPGPRPRPAERRHHRRRPRGAGRDRGGLHGGRRPGR